jgi:hypothetical protein
MVRDKVKVALCISGQPRSSMFCFPYIYDAFMNNNHQVDVFIHTWDNTRVIDLYNPKKVIIEDSKKVLDTLLPNITLHNLKIEGNIEHNILMFYGIKQVYDLVDDDYDIVIRSRFDLLLQHKIDFQSIVDDLMSDIYDIFIPSEDFNMGGYNDQVAIGTKSSMKVYSETLDNINNLSHKLGRWHPESFLGKQLDNNNMRIKQLDWNYRLVRNVSVSTHWPENPYRFLNL